MGTTSVETMGMGLKLPSPTHRTGISRGETGSERSWEMRPGGMLVQKRTDSDPNRPPPPTILVRVKYGSIYHQVHISSQATFGELKKMLSGVTGLHHQYQKLMYKDKERDSNAFLDAVGVKSKSKIVLMEDPISQERRYIETWKIAKMEKAAKSISEISLEIDRLAGQVLALDTASSRGGRVAEKDITDLIELLMNQLLKLDGIIADGDIKLQRKIQVKRVQKHVETLDMLKIKSSNANSSNQQSPSVEHKRRQRHSYEEILSPQVEQVQQPRHSAVANWQPLQPLRHSPSGSVVITTQWETFDAMPTPTLLSQPSTSARSNVAALATGPAQPRFSWDLL